MHALLESKISWLLWFHVLYSVVPPGTSPVEPFTLLLEDNFVRWLLYYHWSGLIFAAMLDECFRVLSPGGKVRITTPDLAFLVDLHQENRAGRSPTAHATLRKRYIEWASATGDLPGTESGFVINHFMRGYGHRFIHDEPILRGLLEKSGFTDVARVGLNESNEAAFRNLANEERMPDGFLHLESFTLEARKPRADPRTA